MGTAEHFGDSLRRLGRLAETSLARARAEAARLTPGASEARPSLRAAEREATDAGKQSARLGWMPILGSLIQRKFQQKSQQAAEAADQVSGLKSQIVRIRDIEARSRSIISGTTEILRRASRAGPPTQSTRKAITSLISRVGFLERDAASGRDPLDVLDRGIEMEREARRILAAWQVAGDIAAQDPMPSVGPRRLRSSRPEAKGQLILDLAGTGENEEEPRIWLPVSASRSREIIALGAQIDRSVSRRGSQLWVPVSERSRVNDFLPLAYREVPPRLSYPPIRHNAVGSNLHEVFDRSSWSHIRTAAYDRAGHRCQICGRQGGSLWNRISSAEERARGGVVECHEVWDWRRSDVDARAGIQRLARLLVTCPDCHLTFHESYARWKAERVGMADQASLYLHNLRCLLNRCDGEEMGRRLAVDREAWERTRDVQRWVLDLSHLAVQDYMTDHLITLLVGNKANVGPDRVGGIRFRTSEGETFSPTSAVDLAGGAPPQRQGGSGDGIARS